jgi:hypothetical protein
MAPATNFVPVPVSPRSRCNSVARKLWRIHQRGQERLRQVKDVFVQLRAVEVSLKVQEFFPDVV